MSGYRRNVNKKVLYAEIRNSRNNMRYNLEKMQKNKGYEIPKIDIKPQYANYGLPNNIEKIIQKKKNVQEIVKLLMVVLLSGVMAWVINYYSGQEIVIFFFTWIFSYSFINIFFEKCGYYNYSPRSEMERNYCSYSRDMEAYEYWKKYKSYQYWMQLDGHQFEEAVAEVFRGIGYKATVSKKGGDGGIDIILEKDNKRIAVQCKAHKKAIGPSVIRDLYGTMMALHYTEGMIVSRSGYTDGVISFAKDKNIKLFTLEKIIELTI